MNDFAARTLVPSGVGQVVSAEDARLVHGLYSGRLMPARQFEAFARLATIFPVRAVSRGEAAPVQSPRDATGMPEIRFASRGEACDLYDYVSRNRVVGLEIRKGGTVRLEYFDRGLDADSRRTSMSMAKSVTSLLVGCAIAQGHIGGLDDQLALYLPRLAGSAYEGVSVRQLLLMASGVQWREDYADPASDRRRMLELQIAQQPGAIMDYMAELHRVGAPGSLWNYSTGETHVAGALVAAATGHSLADYLSDRIWSRLGMDADAAWWLEAPGGLEVAGSGLFATLRDFGRLGQFVAGGGVVAGEPVLPSDWAALSGSCGIVAPGRGHYGLMWWPIPDDRGRYVDGAFRAGGIFGQYIYVNPAQDVVVTVWSQRSKALGAEAIEDNDFFNAVVEALR